MNNIFQNIKTAIVRFAILTLLVMVQVGCEDTPQEDLYFNIIEGSTTVGCTPAGLIEDYLVHSNSGKWRIETLYAEDSDWVTVWPSEGVGDARFSVKIGVNETAFQRQAIVNVVNGSQIISTLTFDQVGTDPYLEVDVKESGRTVSYVGETFSVGVESNAIWSAELVDEADAEWLSIGDFTDTEQQFTCEPNNGDTPRDAEVRVLIYGADLYQTFTIYQNDASTAFEAANKCSIAELLALGEGKIDDNVYIEATVISDVNTNNYPIVYRPNWIANTMIVDDGTAGLVIEFADAAENTYQMGDEMVIHLCGQLIYRDEYSNGLKIDAMTSSAVQSAKAGAGREPIVLTDISQLSNYENQLVTLKDVEFALPYGNLVNINEYGIKYLGTEQPEKHLFSSDYNDLTLEYGHYLRDADGHTAKLYTTWSFLERAQNMIPECSGDITGIVGRRYKADRYKGYATTRQREDSYCIRVRRASDITHFSDTSRPRHSKTIAQFGAWTVVDQPLSKVSSLVGSGQIKHSVGASVKGSAAGTTNEMYWAWAHARNCEAEYNPTADVWTPAYSNSTAVQYIALMAQKWWKNTAASTPEDGCSWIITDLSTAGYNGEISLQFTASSNCYGPIEFQLEWGESETATSWTPIGSPYVCANWHSDISAPEYLFTLPSELSNRDNFTLRLRATRERDASDEADRADGTSRIGILRISALE